MDLNPPAGSKISVLGDGPDPIVRIPAASNPMRYFVGLFLLFWLGGWALGFRAALFQVLFGKATGFLILWLGAWSVFGIFAALTLYRIFRVPVPETLELRRSSVGYDLS